MSLYDFNDALSRKKSLKVETRKKKNDLIKSLSSFGAPIKSTYFICCVQ